MKNAPKKNIPLKQERQLKEILETLIYVKESKDLIKVIVEKVAEIFPLDDVGLLEIRDDGWHRDFAVDYYNHNPISVNIRDAGISGFLPPDEALNSLLKETQITSFKQLSEKFPEHPHFPFLWEGGLREFISGPMYFGGEPFGVFMLWSKEEGRFSQVNIPLFNEIKEYISISLKHIVEREHLEKEKSFKETLLTITESIASINSSKELYKTIFERIKPVFPYDELGLFVLDDSRDFHYELIDQEVLETPISQAIIEDNLGKHTKYKHTGSTADWLMGKGACVISMEELNKKTEHPQLAYMIEAGLKQMISAPLSHGGKSFGLLCFNSLIEDFYRDGDLILFKNIAEQISVAVSNILANEKVLSEKNFKEKLLNISTAVSTITNRKQLFKVIFDDLKSLLDFDNAGLFYIDNEKDVFYEVLEENMTDDIQDELARNNLLGPFPYSGAHPKALIYVDKVSLIDVEEQSKIYPNPQWEVMMNSGLRKMLVSPLQLGGKKIGFICFNTKRTNLYSQDNFRLVGAIAEQMSIALGNVMANEDILKREQEKSQLLQITQKVNELQDLTDFMTFATEHLKPIFGFHDVGIFLLTENKQQHYDLVAIEPDISPSDWSTSLAIDGTALVTHEGSLIEWMINTITKKGKPILFDFKDLQEEFPDYYQFRLKNFLEAGYRDCLASNFKVGEDVYGMFCLNSLQKNHFDHNSIRLFQNVVEQLSIAVSNILANDRIVHEKQFSDTLLHLTEAISSATTPLELYTTIIEPVKKVIPFDQLGLLILEDNKKKHYELISERFDVTAPLTIEGLGKATRYEHKNTPIAWMMDNGPVIVSMDYLVQNTHHPRNKDMVASGVKTLLGGPLIANGELFGMLAFKSKTDNTYTEEHILYYKAISKQVAVTVSNILAQYHLVQEKRFSETLLHITESLSSVRSTNGLYKKIFESIQPVFPFQEMAIILLDQSGNYNYELADNTRSIHRHVPNIDEQLWGRPNIFEHKGSITEWFKENGPITISIEEAEKQAHDELHAYLLADGFHHIIGGPLVSKDKALGILVFFSKEENFYTNKHMPLYKAINEQISLAVSNILATEQVAQKNKFQSLELKLAQKIIAIEKYEYFFGDFLHQLKAFIPFTFAMVHLDRQSDALFQYEWISPKEYRTVSVEQCNTLYDLDATILKKEQMNILNFDVGPDGFINDLKAYKKLPFKKMTAAIPLNAMLKTEYPIDDGNSRLTIVLFHKQPYKFLPSYVEALQSLENTITLSFNNMLASKAIQDLTEQLQLEKTYLETAVREAYNFGDMVGESEAMQKVFQQIKEVSKVDATTLILGETGTGKELIARAIHENSYRKDRVLVKVNCAAIPAQIVESELFGHEKGAFTGAIQRRIGKFELANQGTIFLDEIGEMPLELQTKLLRVIQEREVERLGSNTTISLDIRIIAATNRNLLEEVEKGKFREDLYYRLNGYPIQVPPLRARGEDILLLSDFFVRQFSERYALPFKGFTKNTSKRFLSYSWPGNVRELQNLLEQAVISQKGKVLEVYPGRSGIGNLEWFNTSQNKEETLKTKPIDSMDMEGIKAEKDALEKSYLIKILESYKWRVSGKNGAARKLGVAPSTLESRMRKLNITRS